MSRQRFVLAPAAILSLALAACASQAPAEGAAAPGTGVAPAPDGPAQAACNAEAAQPFIGQPGTEALAEQARAAVGAKSVRMLEPGQPATMDFRGDRLNVLLDEAGNVAQVRCG